MSSELSKIWLSSPHMGGQEQEFVAKAFEENWNCSFRSKCQWI